MRGSRSRFLIFCDFVYVSNTMSPSKIANQSVVRWGEPSRLSVATCRLFRSSMNLRISCSDMVISVRLLGMAPPQKFCRAPDRLSVYAGIEKKR